MVVEPTLTGDEAYQRRLAMSNAAKPRTSPPILPPVTGGDDSDIPGLSMGNVGVPNIPRIAETGDEAYLRRLAMSTAGTQQPQTQNYPASPPSPPTLAYDPFAPPSVPPPPPGPIPSALEAKVRAAAAIAAKLGALGASVPSMPPPPAEDEK